MIIVYLLPPFPSNLSHHNALSVGRLQVGISKSQHMSELVSACSTVIAFRGGIINGNSIGIFVYVEIATGIPIGALANHSHYLNVAATDLSSVQR